VNLNHQDRIQEEWDKKILATEAMMPTPSGALGSGALFIDSTVPADQVPNGMQALVQAQKLSADKGLAEKEAAEAEAQNVADALQQELDANAAANAAAQTATAVVLAQQAASDYFLRAMWSEENVAGVKVKDLGDVHRGFLNWLAAAVVQWSQCGVGEIPYSTLFGDPADCSEHFQLLRDLVGAEYWQSLYGSRVVLASSVVPMHLHTVLTAAITKIAATLEETSEKKVVAALKIKAAGKFNLLNSNSKTKTTKT
jgi:hypothetical protein